MAFIEDNDAVEARAAYPVDDLLQTAALDALPASTD